MPTRVPGAIRVRGAAPDGRPCPPRPVATRTTRAGRSARPRPGRAGPGGSRPRHRRPGPRRPAGKSPRPRPPQRPAPRPIARATPPPPPAARTARPAWPCRGGTIAPPARAARPGRSPSPADRSTASACPFRQPPQTFSRGNTPRSTRSTRAPAAASSRAAIVPAGPAPITAASHGPSLVGASRGAVLLLMLANDSTPEGTSEASGATAEPRRVRHAPPAGPPPPR